MDRSIRLISQSFKAVRSFKIRTLFCVLSVALGIAAITIIVAATEGAYKKAFDIVAVFGPDSIMIVGGSDESHAIGQHEHTITMGDVDAIRESFPTAYLAVPMSAVRDVTVSYKGRKYQTQVVGSTSDYSRTWTWPVVEGSDFTEEDVKRLANVGLIGQEVARELFIDENPIGKTILVRNMPVAIVGTLSEKGATPGGGSLDNRLVMPITTVMRKLQNEAKYVQVARVRFLDQANLDGRIEETRQFLRERHRIPAAEPDDFRIFSSRDIIKFLVALTGSLVIFLGIVGLISLVVAGFVLANLFLLSVKERVGEIGIRRSVGAKRADILFQFLGEAVLITTAGGFIGFLVGVASSYLLQYIAEFPIFFSWKAFAIGLFLSWIIGIVFGLQPARQAANLEPIEAIRT